MAIVVLLLALYLQDRRQKEHTIRRNFPVLGRMRYGLERLGVFLRQYLYANDEEERPFNRITRAWVYESAKGKGGTIGFGSELEINRPGMILFANSLFRPWKKSGAKANLWPSAEKIASHFCQTYRQYLWHELWCFISQGH